MDLLEDKLSDRNLLFGAEMTTDDIRLSRHWFGTVYATHFRWTRKRLVKYSPLWRFTRQIYHTRDQSTIDFEAIRFGYYVNGGSHNPFKIIAQQPIIDWECQAGFDAQFSR